MAPKNKFTREEMVDAALSVVRTQGMEALTAKALAKALGISTQPVFTCFGSMDVLKQDVHAAAERIYDEYAEQGLRQKISFLGFGMQYIRFAREEPELYRLLFFTKADESGGALAAMKHSREKLRPSLEKTYRIGATEADRYFRDLWLAVHSIAVLIVTGVCAMLLFQVFENVGMAMGIMPVTGLPLPFFSYGGTNLIINMMNVALVFSVSLRGRRM